MRSRFLAVMMVVLVARVAAAEDRHEWEPRIRASWRKEFERGVAALQKSGVVLRAVSRAERTTFGEVSARYRQARAKAAHLVELSATIAAAAAAP